MKNTPNDERALAVGRAVLALFEALGIDAKPSAPTIYTQHAPPPDAASADAFVRIHRAELRAGTPGWSRCGAVRSVTAAAWSQYVSAQTEAARAKPKRIAPNAAPVAANDIDAEIDAALGIKTRRGGSR